MPLNINLQQILLHALNFVILFGAMYFLLYKPVKSFMDSRKAHYEKMDEDAKAVLAEAEKTKADYEAQLKSADEEIARKVENWKAGLAKGEISELMSAAAEKLVLSSTSDAYDKFLDTAEERKDNG